MHLKHSLQRCFNENWYFNLIVLIVHKHTTLDSLNGKSEEHYKSEKVHEFRCCITCNDWWLKIMLPHQALDGPVSWCPSPACGWAKWRGTGGWWSHLWRRPTLPHQYSAFAELQHVDDCALKMWPTEKTQCYYENPIWAEILRRCIFNVQWAFITHIYMYILYM